MNGELQHSELVTTSRLDFTLGTTPIHGDDLLAKCDTFPPSNCKTGSYILFDKNKKNCYCRADCDDFSTPVKVGESCDKNGETMCTAIASKTGSSKADTCLTKAWRNLNLCH